MVRGSHVVVRIDHEALDEVTTATDQLSALIASWINENGVDNLTGLVPGHAAALIGLASSLAQRASGASRRLAIPAA